MKDAYLSPHSQDRVALGGPEMAYVDAGMPDGPAIVLLHGNPTSSYLWRNVIPYLECLGRCLAPDLIGMGNSDPCPNGRYRFLSHLRYFDAWMNAVCPERDVILVGHEWGAAIAFDWASRNPDRVRGIAHMEGVLYPRHWTDRPGRPARPSAVPGVTTGLALMSDVLDPALQIARGCLRPVSASDMAVYVAPYPDLLSLAPVVTLQQEMPVHGDLSDVSRTVAGNAAWLARWSVPKLFLNASRGQLAIGRPRDLCRGWQNQREIQVHGSHMLPEDSPETIGPAIAEFVMDVIGRPTISGAARQARVVS